MKREEITQERVIRSLEEWRNRKGPIEFPEDVEVISQHIREIFSVELPPHDVEEFWAWYSEEVWCAGWLVNPTQRDVERGFPKWISFLEGTLWDEGVPFGWDDP